MRGSAGMSDRTIENYTRTRKRINNNFPFLFGISGKRAAVGRGTDDVDSLTAADHTDHRIHNIQSTGTELNSETQKCWNAPRTMQYGELQNISWRFRIFVSTSSIQISNWVADWRRRGKKLRWQIDPGKQFSDVLWRKQITWIQGKCWSFANLPQVGGFCWNYSAVIANKYPVI